MNSHRRRCCLLIMALLFASSCGSTTSTSPPSSSTSLPVASSTPENTSTPASTSASSTTSTSTQPATGFDGHTSPRLESIDAYEAFARTGTNNQSVVKFTIPDILDNTSVQWMDSNFYELHDEWYWFHLLNGEPVPGSPTAPLEGFEFASIDDVYTWAQNIEPSELPLDLRFVDSRSFGRRLYSPEFYRLALDSDPRVFGAGSLVRLESGESDIADRWLIELEYSDDVTPEEVALFFDRLVPTLAGEIGSNLEWVIRSPHQEAIADRMVAEALPYADRIVRYSDLVPQGQVSVYNEGIAAGRLLVIGEGGADITDAVDTDIVIMENVPDWLPPASALITSAPQTPLAHVNLLARNRGIPNASQAGVLDDAQIRQAARVRAPAIVRSSGTDDLEVVLITEEQFRRWRALASNSKLSVPPVDPSHLPWTIDLEELASEVDSEADAQLWRPIVGGKSAGFLALLSADGVTTPESPLAVTVAPYMLHLDSVRGALDAILSNSSFASSTRARFLVLEGPEDFAEQYPADDDAEFARSFTARHRPGTPLGDVLAAGGFKQYFRDAPMDPAVLAGLTQELEERFGDYAVTQGLRFRSSSSVEDLEGFSGAGLYDSNTGFLDPEAQPDEGDHKKTVERTIKKTWASYWGFEAFEERRREGVEHVSGAMGVLIHARFDDPMEVNNGVATFTLLPGRAEDSAVATINVQLGDESVTNPDPLAGELPEVIQVTLGADGAVEVTRIASSTLSPDEEVFTDADAQRLVEQLQSVAVLWRDRVNISLPREQHIETLTLDYEFKTMAPGWPAKRDGTPNPGRVVVKQARSLDPGLRDIPLSVLQLPIPRDVLARARSVVEVSCDGEIHVEVLTDPLLAPDVGYSVEPFVTDRHSTDADGCKRTVLHSTPDQFLIELLEQAAQT